MGGGAAIGAGAGLLLGSAAGAGQRPGGGCASYQAVFDNAYTQCMVSRGDTVQARAYYPRPYYGYAYGYPGYYAAVLRAVLRRPA